MTGETSVTQGTIGLWVKLRRPTTSTTLSYLSATPYTYKFGTNSTNYYQWNVSKDSTWRDNEWQYLPLHITTISTTVGTVNITDINYRAFMINTSEGSAVTSIDWIVRLNGISPSNSIGPNYIGDRRVLETTYTYTVNI